MNVICQNSRTYEYQKETRGRAAIALYHLYIEDWFRYFPRNNFLFIKSEDYFADVRGNLKNVFSFLDLPAISKEELEEDVRSSPKNVGKRKERVGGMMNSTRVMLKDFFKPHNERLAQLLGDPTFLWN